MNITELPYDVLEAIRSFLDQDSIDNLCLTCTGFMDWLQKDAYYGLWLNENIDRGRSSLALQSGPRAKFIRHIRYQPGDPCPMEDENHRPSIKMSAESREVLRSLAKFPNLETFHFYVDWDLDSWKEGACHFIEDGVDEDEPWYQLLHESFLALSESHGAFTRLEIEGLPPTTYPAHHTENWRLLLNPLTFLSMTLPEIEDDNSWGGLNRCSDGYLLGLVDAFLKHSPNMEHLRIAGGEEGIIGNYHNREPILWEYVTMPRIKVFELEWSCVEDSVVTFIKNHSRTLEKVRLTNCIVEYLHWWNTLFKQIQSSNSPQLVDFVATQARPSRHDSENKVVNEQFYACEIHDKYGDLQNKADLLDSDDEREVYDSDDDAIADVLEELSGVQAMVTRNIAALE